MIDYHFDKIVVTNNCEGIFFAYKYGYHLFYINDELKIPFNFETVENGLSLCDLSSKCLFMLGIAGLIPFKDNIKDITQEDGYLSVLLNKRIKVYYNEIKTFIIKPTPKKKIIDYISINHINKKDLYSKLYNNFFLKRDSDFINTIQSVPSRNDIGRNELIVISYCHETDDILKKAPEIEIKFFIEDLLTQYNVKRVSNIVNVEVEERFIVDDFVINFDYTLYESGTTSSLLYNYELYFGNPFLKTINQRYARQ